VGTTPFLNLPRIGRGVTLRNVLVALCAGAFVIIQTNSRKLTFIVGRGSRNTHVNDLAIKLHKFCTKHSKVLKVKSLPRDLNKAADDMNKI
jgi:hypothetical protein